MARRIKLVNDVEFPLAMCVVDDDGMLNIQIETDSTLAELTAILTPEATAKIIDYKTDSEYYHEYEGYTEPVFMSKLIRAGYVYITLKKAGD